MLKHVIRSKGQNISFISNSYAVFKLPNFFQGIVSYLGNESGDVKSYKGKESTNTAPEMIANILRIKSYA